VSDRARLAILASHPIQYQAPLFRRLAADGRIDLHVVFLSRHGTTSRADPGFGVNFSWDVDLLAGYASSFVRNLRERARPGGALSYVNPEVVGALRRLAPDAVLFQGVRNPTSLAALAWARAASVARLYRAESSVLHARPARSRAAAGALLRSMSAVLPIGTANDLYYAQLGVPERARELAPYSVDNAFFAARRMARDDARAQLELAGDEVVLLFSGKLQPRKALDTLIEACAGLPGQVRIVVAGDGPERGRLEALARTRGVRLTVLGFLNQTQLPAAYSAADLLVLPSLDEPWGLVVNEGMCFGLPAVVSSQVGCRLDLVVPGVTGDVFRAGDPADLRRALAPLIADPALRAACGAQAAQRIARWDVPDTAEGVIRAVQRHA
jgi:glycosyltransferase involved in cell wall biosynthesis